MTSRRNPPPRPTTPEDPTLQSRPPPRKCQFPLRSFGPAAAADIRTTSIEALDRQAPPSTGSRTYDIQDSRDLLETITQWENASWREDGLSEPDPTWGYYVMLTDYSPAARSKVDRAMENLLRMQRRSLGAEEHPPNVYADEVYRRMRFDLVEDQEALEGASYDRVRACIRAQVRGLELCDDEDATPAATRYCACLVLDGDKIDMLANLPLNEEDVRKTPMPEPCKLPVLSICWKRPETTRDSYRGVWEFAIDLLPRICELLETQQLQEIEKYMESYGR
jgi:hypothetical protein